MPKPEKKNYVRFGVNLENTEYRIFCNVSEAEILKAMDETDRRKAQRYFLTYKKRKNIELSEEEKKLDASNKEQFRTHSKGLATLKRRIGEELFKKNVEKFGEDVKKQNAVNEPQEQKAENDEKKDVEKIDAEKITVEIQELKLEIAKDDPYIEEKQEIVALANDISKELEKKKYSKYATRIREIAASSAGIDDESIDNVADTEKYLGDFKKGLEDFQKVLKSGEVDPKKHMTQLDAEADKLSKTIDEYAKSALPADWEFYNVATKRKEVAEKNQDGVYRGKENKAKQEKKAKHQIKADAEKKAEPEKAEQKEKKSFLKNMQEKAAKMVFWKKKQKPEEIDLMAEANKIEAVNLDEDVPEKVEQKENDNKKVEPQNNEVQKNNEVKNKPAIENQEPKPPVQPVQQVPPVPPVQPMQPVQQADAAKIKVDNDNKEKEKENNQNPAANNVNDPKVPENAPKNEDNNDNKKKVENPNPAEADDKKDLDKKDNLNPAEQPKEKEKEKDKDKVEEEEKEKDKDKVNDKDKVEDKEKEKEKEKDKNKDDNKDKEKDQEPVQADVKKDNVQNVPNNNQPEQNVNQNQENIDKNVEEKNNNEKQKDNALEERPVVDPIRRAKTVAEYEDSLSEFSDTNSVVFSNTLMRGEKEISELDKAALQTTHNKMMQGENKLRALLPEKLDKIMAENISIPGLIKNQMLLEEGRLSPDQKFNHYRNILAIKDMDGDKYSKQLMDYRLKVAEEAGREFDKKHQDPSKLSFLNKSANAIENVMCAMSRNPLGIGILLVAAINAPLLIVGLLAFTAWKRKRPNPEYQQAWKEQNQRELETKRQQLARLYNCDASELSDREVTKALKADYVHGKVVEALDEKLERDSKKEVDKITKDYAKAISKGSKDKVKAKELKDLAQKQISPKDSKKDRILELTTGREERIKSKGGFGL